MKLRIAIALTLTLAGACKKSTGGGGGGGGTGWLVGASGMMLRVAADGTTSSYAAPTTESLNAIACRYAGEAWVAGNHGTLLYTSDAGATWRPQAVPTTADLRAVATQDLGPVFVAGNGALLASTDTGASWVALTDDGTGFRSIAAAQGADTVIAVSEDGGLWSVDHAGSKFSLTRRGQLAGARAVAVSPDGQTVIVAGDAMVARSADGGRTFQPLASPEAVRFDDVRVDESGEAIAVGSGGAIARIGADGAIAIQHFGSANLHALHIAESEDGDAIGMAGGDGGELWITRDSGHAWTRGPSAGQTVLGVDQIGAAHR
jgi:photosystem II stability/assembly factor-like uncharacterized protein